MNHPFQLVALASLLLAACAPDRHGDLRTRVAIDRSAVPARLTFDGVGVGSPPAAAAAVLGDDWVPPVREADFGTRLTTLWSPRADGAVGAYYLDYDGNPVALAKLAARWREVFLAAGGGCVEDRYCDVMDVEADRVAAAFSLQRRWLVPVGVTVRIHR